VAPEFISRSVAADDDILGHMVSFMRDQNARESG
jgi:hypothetical protein